MNNGNQLNFFDLGHLKKREIPIKIKSQKRFLLINGKKVEADFKANYFNENPDEVYEEDGCNPHLEIKGQPNIITETGYRSIFFDFEILKEATSFEEMVENLLKSQTTKPIIIKWI